MTAPQPDDAPYRLAVVIDAALRIGADGTRVAALVQEHGWHPQPEPESDLLEGLLASGEHVPVRILRARRAG